jgi:NAD(P)-dependent dehydrogenase (short-subunit alcohol dehydrogenase family)
MTALDGRIALVTGATGGIGKETARALVAAGADVIVVGRDRARLDALTAELGPRAFPELADLSAQAEVRALAERVRARTSRLDILVNNAGAIHDTRSVSADGLERTFALNHMAYFLLTVLLEDPLAAARARVVNVASDAHRRGRIAFDDLQSERSYSGWGAYSASKLANILFSNELARRWAERGVTSNALHPGVIASGFALNNTGWFTTLWKLASPLMRTPEQGARTTLHVAMSPDVAGVSGHYFSNCRQVPPTGDALDEAAARRLWEASEELCGLRGPR